MTFTRLLVPTFAHMLTALSGWLDKARRQMTPEDATALPSARLAPDMFPLATQVRFACVQAQEAIARMQAQPFPPSVALLLDEGRNAVERPGTIADAQARISETLALLANVGPDALDLPSDTPIAHALPNAMIFDLIAETYARDWALAQFYFHIMAAYAILRSAGAELGKADYIPHLLPHLRMAEAG